MLTADQISKTYFRKTGEANYFYAVAPTDLQIPAGAVTVLTGKSGSGKTTLLHMLSGLLPPTEGRVWLDDTDLYSLKDAALSRLRYERIGVVPQARSAVDTLTVLENIFLPSMIYGSPAPEKEAAAWLAEFEMSSLKGAMPHELSGGELRRMAIIRAVIRCPDVLFADEPTGDLDAENTAKVLSALSSYAHRENKAVFIVTHEQEAAGYADRLLKMENGRITEDP